MLTCGVRTKTQHGAAVFGTDGWIEVPPLFWQADRIILHAGKEDKEMVEFAEAIDRRRVLGPVEVPQDRARLEGPVEPRGSSFS